MRREILKDCPTTRVILLTNATPKTSISWGHQGGIRGFVWKSQVAEDLVRAIEEVHGGAFYLCPGVSQTSSRRIWQNRSSFDP